MRPMLALTLSLAASPALAHEFALLLVAPQGATEAALAQMETAFLIASHERDSHPDETSEGHLGGMDVQLTLARLDDAEAAPDLAFVLAPMAGPGEATVQALAAPGDAVVVDASHLAGAAGDLSLGDDGLASFAQRFRAETGADPGPEAVATYLAAHLVNLAVRPRDSVDDRAALRRALPVP